MGQTVKFHSWLLQRLKRIKGLQIGIICWAMFANALTYAAPNPIVEKARQLLQKRDRQGAAELVNQEIKREKAPHKIQELQKELEKITTMFLTNDGQKNYELAESLRFTGQEGYIEKYEESLKTEDQNTKVLLGLATGQHVKKKCDLALAQIQQGLKMNPLSLELKLALIKNTLCSNRVWTEEEALLLEPLKDHVFFKLARVEQAYKLDQTEEAQSRLREAAQADKDFPPVSYWQWKLGQADSSDRSRLAAQEYLRVCKTLTPSIKRKYFFEPNLCIEHEVVEEYLKKTEGNQ